MRNEVLFREEQRFRQTWIWILVFAACVPAVAIFGYGMVKQLVLDRPWGERPMSDTALLLAGALSISLGFALVWLFWVANLVTEVRADGLYLRFFPFHRSWHKIPLENLVSCEAKTYRPIGEYGGWGIRWTWSRKGKTYNVSGDRGVRLDYDDGKHLLIGSQQADELAAALQSLLQERRHA